MDHGDLYGLAAELVATLRALDDLAGTLARQTASYGEGRLLRDDLGADPYERLTAAATAADDLRSALATADRRANTYWSAIGHIGVEFDLSDDPEPHEAGGAS